MIADEMHQKLTQLQPTRLEIIDESEQHRGHGGWQEGGETHFRVILSSGQFAGLSRIARHRLVHSALGDIVPRIHALALELSES